MPHLIRERRGTGGIPPYAEERRRAFRMSRWNGPVPENDVIELALAAVSHRLAQFGLDADASPLLIRRKRGF